MTEQTTSERQWQMVTEQQMGNKNRFDERSRPYHEP